MGSLRQNRDRIGSARTAQASFGWIPDPAAAKRYVNTHSTGVELVRLDNDVVSWICGERSSLTV